MSRKPGHVVVHRLSRVVDGHPTASNAATFVRCVCSRAFHADTIEQARALYEAHLDRVEAVGKPVDRDAPPTHPPLVE